MLKDGIKRLAHRLGLVRGHRKTGATQHQPSTFVTEFDTTWHGDHWQNLLASPLDARHYVVEDWTPPVYDEVPDTPPARRRRRWYEQ